MFRANGGRNGVMCVQQRYIRVRIRVRNLQLFDQDEAAVSEGEGSLDRTTGRHCRDGFYDQDEAAVSEGEGTEEIERELGLGLGLDPSRLWSDPIGSGLRLGLRLG